MSWTIEPEEKIKVVFEEQEIAEIDRNISVEEFIRKVKEIAKQLGIARFNLYDDQGNEVLPTQESIEYVLRNANVVKIVKADTAG